MISDKCIVSVCLLYVGCGCGHVVFNEIGDPHSTFFHFTRTLCSPSQCPADLRYLFEKKGRENGDIVGPLKRRGETQSIAQGVLYFPKMVLILTRELGGDKNCGKKSPR